jgi:hypothetical protein
MMRKLYELSIMKKILAFILLSVSLNSNADLQTTPYGQIVGIETRGQNMHIQTNFSSGDKLGCAVSVGAIYMYDFSAAKQGDGDQLVQSVLLAAFMAGKDVSFHLYECNTSGSRPVIGHVRVK